MSDKAFFSPLDSKRLRGADDNCVTAMRVCGKHPHFVSVLKVGLVISKICQNTQHILHSEQEPNAKETEAVQLWIALLWKCMAFNVCEVSKLAAPAIALCERLKPLMECEIDV